MHKRRVVLAGGSGFLGRALSDALVERGDHVTVLTRTPGVGGDARLTYIGWDGKSLGDWTRALDGADAVVNLAGRNVSCRYTEENRREILQSRIDSVRAIARALEDLRAPPPVIVQAGSLAFYGNAGDRECDEHAPAGSGFSADVCVAWERAFGEIRSPTRRVLLRIGFVLGRGNDAFEMLLRLTRRFLGGAVGNGVQYVSWLHVRAFVRLVSWSLESAGARGVYNATSPNPVTNAEFMRALRVALARPWSPPTPGWAVALGSRFMGTEPSLALEGRRGLPKRLLEEGFMFELDELRAALADLITK